MREVLGALVADRAHAAVVADAVRPVARPAAVPAAGRPRVRAAG